MKLVINKCYGGFGLSVKGIQRWAELSGRPCYFFRLLAGRMLVSITAAEAEGEFCSHAYDIPDPAVDMPHEDHQRYALNPDTRRDNTFLVQVVEELGAAANGRHAKLAVVEIPDDVDWTIEEYDGQEWVAERHRTWS